MSRRTYSQTHCWLCGKDMSANGLAVYNHKMAHVRRGEMTVRKWIDGSGYTRITFDRVPKPKETTDATAT